MFVTSDGREFKTQDKYLNHQSEIYYWKIKALKQEALGSKSEYQRRHYLSLASEIEKLKMEIDTLKINIQ